ncbi:PHOT2 [Symbiodinium natans]|uniref:PHOT2 protein n=1 Tax=Symbiodinium natans TaxID=878477 RepID=A0A812Q6E2_9DINO|nr:PHOT2 [Symbiodinium natans]
MRRHAKDFCEAIRAGKQFRIPDREREDWMPPGRPTDELFCFQRNARKDCGKGP